MSRRNPSRRRRKEEQRPSMDIGLSWISDIASWFAQMIPQWALCDTRHGGVKFVGRIFSPGVKVVEIKPGLYWWWPVTTEVQIIPTAHRAVDLPSQSLDTKDGKPIMISMRLVVEIDDVVKAITHTVDIDDLIMEIGGTAAVKSVVTRNWTPLRTAQANTKDGVSKELLTAAKKLLKKYGVKVLQASFVDCCKHIPHRVEGGGSILTVSKDEE